MTAVQIAWQAAEDAWRAAGATVPCFDPAYMAARDRLAAIKAVTDGK